MLEISSLSKQFGNLTVLDGLDLNLQTGELRVLIGPNGSGKSTLLNIISGDLKPDAGDVRLYNQTLLSLSPMEIARLGVLRKFQTPGVFDSMTVFEHLTIPYVLTHAKTNEKAILDMADKMQLVSVLDKHVSILSTGQRQWLEMAMLLLMKPNILLLDEPASGMTPDELLKTLSLLKDLNNRGLTILIIEHNMQFVRALDTKITVLLNGKSFVTGQFSEIQQNKKVQDNYLGTLYV